MTASRVTCTLQRDRRCRLAATGALNRVPTVARSGVRQSAVATRRDVMAQAVQTERRGRGPDHKGEGGPGARRGGGGLNGATGADGKRSPLLARARETP